MSESINEVALRNNNFRLCRLCTWPNYSGLGFHLENASQPPHIIRSVESNSPAAAAGLRILDVVLAVNNQDVSGANYNEVKNAINNARNNSDRIELLVIEKRVYVSLKKQRISFDPRFAQIIETPTTMPSDYLNFPANTPRTCEIRLSETNPSFGFEVVRGENDIGAYIQVVFPNSPASRTPLRKSDRIIEIDDKFVDKEPIQSILEKLAKAKKRGVVKLYVVDTQTYKYFQDNNISLKSKNLRKSTYGNQQSISPYVNVDMPSVLSVTGGGSPPPSSASSTLPDYQQTNLPGSLKIPGQHQDDIRLCTITRANATDTYGIELNYHKREQYHSMKIISGRNNETSNAALAGVKSEDRLIEINGENIENIDAEPVKQRIRAIKYPQPLQVLVADTATYNYYKQQHKRIHHDLPSVKKLPENLTGPSPSSLAQPLHQETSERSISTITQPPVNKPSTITVGLVESNPVQPRISTPSSPANRRQYRLTRIPGFEGYGFSVNSNQLGDIAAHKITQIAPNSPAEQQGLRVGDHIITVNNQNVQYMDPAKFNQFFRTSAQNAGARGDPLLLEVINEDSYQPLPSLAQPSIQKPTSRKSSVSYASATIDETYPDMRLCTIRPWPQYPDLGFQIIQSSSAFGENDGYRIQQLQKDSPAAHTNIHNNDYIIEVNREKIEKRDYQYVQDLINNSYRKDQQIKLLVIDDNGYQWYKNHHYPLDSLSPKANIIQYNTPDPSPTVPPVNPNIMLPSTVPPVNPNIILPPTFPPVNPNIILPSTVPPVNPNIILPPTVPPVNPNVILPPTPHIPIESISSRDKTSISTIPPVLNQPDTNGYDSLAYDPSSPSGKKRSVTSSYYRSRKHLSRGTVDLVSEKLLLRFCRLITEPGQSFGFQIRFDDNKHIVYNIEADSPAARAGLNENDRLIEVGDEDIQGKSNKEVAGLVRNAAHNGVLRLLIVPNNVKPLTKRSAKSLITLNDEHYFRKTTSRSADEDKARSSSTDPYRSVSRLNGEQIDRDRSFTASDFSDHSFEPTEPLPRKCVLIRDPSFRGCGFRLIEKQNYDTPIVVEVCPNSPAKRSGLTEGDHIIYIESLNVQKLGSFNEIIRLIHRTFEENDQVTLITLTGPGYQVLRRRGGYLDSIIFDYQLLNIDQMKPRLCKLHLHNHESDFGLTLHRDNSLYVKNVEQGSPADLYGVRKGDIVLELNGQFAKYLSLNQIKKIIETSKQERKLNILVIDIDGYQFSMKHAIPLNSLLPFVQTREDRNITTDSRTPYEPIYL